MSPQTTEILFNWEHGVMVASVLAPFLLFWWDSRRQSARHHTEALRQQAQLHTENMQRFTAIETKIGPIWEWWNAVRSRDRRFGE